MTRLQQPASPVPRGKRSATLVAGVDHEWLEDDVAPRPLSAVRGRVRVPAEGPLVSFESALERDFLLFCRTEPMVRSVHAQRLRLHFTEQSTGKRRRYTPDFVVELDENAAAPFRRVVIEVKTWTDLWRSRRSARAPYAAAREWCSRQSHTVFRIMTDRRMTGHWLANTRLLSGQLDVLVEIGFEARCRELFGQWAEFRISQMLASAQQRGLNPQAVLPVLYQMVARGELWLDRGQPITMSTWVTVGSPRRL